MRVLTVNTGSSSVKLAIFTTDSTGVQLVATASADRIGPSSHGTALREVIGRLSNFGPFTAVAHRVVHGGTQHVKPEVVTDALLMDLRGLTRLAPDHLPSAISAIEFTANTFDVPQVVCFDTAFHNQLPVVAQMFPLPRRFFESGIRRYGFHGLSCESVMLTLATDDAALAGGQIVIAHLGNGASMTAVRQGRSVDTTMGLTPVGGLMMGTRSGDLDPGALLHLLASFGDDRQVVSTMVSRQAGLLGVSDRSSDMRDLLAAEATDPKAAQAIDLFCYLAKKSLGGLFAVLGRVDGVIFTGGIGEHAARIRSRICDGLDGLGLRLDAAANDRHDPVISAADSAVKVRIAVTDEDAMLARHAHSVLQARGRDVRV